MIPRVIHYCWFGGRPLPATAKAYVDSWRKHCPGYEVRRWDEKSFDVSQCRFARQTAEKGEWAFLSDYARLKIVYDQGGIYLDTDVELIRPLDELLRFEAFFGFQQDHTVATGLGFGAVRGHPVLASLLSTYETHAFLGADGRPDRKPCPQRDTPVIERFGFRLDGAQQELNGVVILPAECLSPKSFSTGRVTLTTRTYAIHHFESSWHSPLEAAHCARRRRYGAMFGERCGRWLYQVDCRVRNLGVKWGLGPRWSDEHTNR